MTMITPIDKTDDELLNSFERRNRSKVRLALKRIRLWNVLIEGLKRLLS